MGYISDEAVAEMARQLDAAKRTRDELLAGAGEPKEAGPADIGPGLADDRSHASPPASTIRIATYPASVNTMPEAPAPHLSHAWGSLPAASARPECQASPPPVQRYESPPERAPTSSSVSSFRQPAETSTRSTPREPDIILGADRLTRQYGQLGTVGRLRVGIDLNGCHTIALVGIPGFGKSYSLGVLAEMACLPNPRINLLPSPLACVWFHMHRGESYAPEHLAATAPNDNVADVERLRFLYGATPTGLTDVVLLAPEPKVNDRRREYPGIDVRAIKFASSELGAAEWRLLMASTDAFYTRQVLDVLRRHSDDLRLDAVRADLAAIGISQSALRYAEERLRFAEKYIDDSQRLGAIMRPGRTIVVDLRDDWMDPDEALALFMVMMRIFSAARCNGREINKLMVLDEAHKYMVRSGPVTEIVETVREMRHRATSVVIASQDPVSLPQEVIELASIAIAHRITSHEWLRHLRSALTAFAGIKISELAHLRPGEALAWAQRCNDVRFTHKPMCLTLRPRLTRHGGGTKTAI